VHTLCRLRVEFVVKQSSWIEWVIAELIAELVTELITEADMVGLMCDGSWCQTGYAHLRETRRTFH
jgi:hypothetical protein